MEPTHSANGLTLCQHTKRQSPGKAKWRSWILSLVLTLSSASATAAGWYTGEIATIQLNQNGGIFVWVTGSNNNECGSTRMDYVFSNESTGKSILAALLSWQAQGRAVMFYIETCFAARGIFTDVKNAN